MRGAIAALALAACTQSPPRPTTNAEAPATVGALLFSDPSLSEPVGQACADCHAARLAFRDPEVDHTTSMGVVAGRFGSRNTQSAMYAALVPPLHYDPEARQTAGGLFWDGRADSLEDQATGPLMNPLEMANPSKQRVVEKLRLSPNAEAFRAAFGDDALDDVDHAYANMTAALAAFERTPTFAPFSSRYDRYLAGDASLDASEKRGLAIFEDPARGNCASCHPNRPAADGSPPMFTNYLYANLGVPAYANNLFYEQPASLNPDGANYLDRGLGRTLDDAREDGKFRTPTLRNIGRTAPYGHNGYFANLGYFVDFLNTRDTGSELVGTCSRVQPNTRCAWPAPEVAATIDHRVGALKLSEPETDDLVAFLKTLDDQP
ncbi:cytochrome-c peroxidase [soil metagenome]